MNDPSSHTPDVVRRDADAPASLDSQLSVNPAIKKPIAAFGERLASRLLLRDWFRSLRASAWPTFGVLAVAVIFSRILGHPWAPESAVARIAVCVTAVLVWSLACLFYTLLRRPTPESALALVDRRANTGETLLSAHAFERRASRVDAGEALHMQRASRALDDARGKVSEYVPLRAPWSSLLAPLFFCAVALSIVVIDRVTMPEDRTVDATEVADAMADEAKRLDDEKKALTPEESKALDELKKEMKASAEKMKEQEKQSSRKVLEALEKQAREAEKLAAELKAMGEKVSSALLAELERHADTAALAGALRAEDMKRASAEALKLAERLASETLTHEERSRISTAFQAGLKKASAKDLKTALGRHLAAAQKRLDKQDAKGASRELRELARKYKKAANRLRMRNQLRRLARNLRASGQRALGKSGRTMKQLRTMTARRNLKSLRNSSSTQPIPLTRRYSSYQRNQPNSNRRYNSHQSSTAPTPGTQPPPGNQGPC